MEIRASSIFDKWFDGVSELRFHFGPGYRVYFTERGGIIFVLMAGGIKDTQSDDIALAKKLAKAL